MMGWVFGDHSLHIPVIPKWNFNSFGRGGRAVSSVLHRALQGPHVPKEGITGVAVERFLVTVIRWPYLSWAKSRRPGRGLGPWQYLPAWQEFHHLVNPTKSMPLWTLAWSLKSGRLVGWLGVTDAHQLWAGRRDVEPVPNALSFLLELILYFMIHSRS